MAHLAPWKISLVVECHHPRKEPRGLLVHFDKKLIPILRSKREFSSLNITCSRAQFFITIAYLSIRTWASPSMRCVEPRRRRFCTRSHIRGHLLSQIADYCSRRVGYCEQGTVRARRGDIERWRAGQHVVLYSNCFLSSMATFPSPLSDSCRVAPPHDPACRALGEIPEE
jgi:hypothetical protein